MIDALALGGRRLRSWLTSSSISGETEEERGSERNRRAVASSVVGLALRGSSFAVVLISVPLTLGVLGPIRFGMWMTIASVVALLSATDLGIGNGVLNAVARAFGQGDTTAARQYLASGFVALTAIALVLGLIFLILYPVVPWASIYNVANEPLAASEAGPATGVFVATFLIGLPLSLVGQARAAYQEGFIQSSFAGFGNVLTIGLLLAAVAANANLPVLVLAMTSGPLLAATANLIILVRVQRPGLSPRPRDVTSEAMRSVVKVGLGFMVLQIAYTVGFSMDRLVVAHVVGPEAVADYSVVYRLFSIPAGLAAIALLPLWPAYREAISRHDIAWVRATLGKSLRVTMGLAIPPTVVLIVTGPGIVALWTNHTLAPAHGLYPALGAFTVVFALANVFAMLLNGAQVMRFLITTMSLMAILNLGASIYLAQRIGVAGVALGSVIAILVALIGPAVLYVPGLIRRLEHHWPDPSAIPPLGGRQ
jgi:O-antigen/teichoic acid export membrane protein